MPIHRLTHFSNPDLLQTIAPETLWSLLVPHARALKQSGLSLPASGADFHPDYAQLAKIFVSAPEGLPEELVEALHYVDAMSTPDGMDGLLQALPDLNPPWHHWTPADVAVQAWLLDRDRFERVFAERQVSRRSRKFLTFHSPTETAIAQPWHPRLLDELESALASEFAERGRGGGVKVFVSERDDGIWFLIRHGDPLRREACLSDGQSGSVFFRPERYDAVVVVPQRGELRINTTTRWQKELYRRLFGTVLLGDPNGYPGDDRYTLEPLLSDGPRSLVTSDLPGIVSIRLIEIRFVEPGRGGLGTTHWSDDLFAVMGDSLWQIPAGAQLTGAKFLVRFMASRSWRTVTIIPPNEVKYSLEGDAAHVQEWLEKRGFLVTVGWGEDDVVDETETVLACA